MIKPASLRKLGLLLTVIWLGAVLSVLIWGSGSTFGSPGLRGFIILGFTPLALLWLTWAVLRQSRTLRMIEGQLHLQIQESQRLVVQQKRVVEQQTKMVEQQTKMVEDLRVQRAKELQASTPLLQVKALGIGGTVRDRNIVHFVLLNHGKTCTGVVLSFGKEHASQEFSRLPDGGELPFNLALPTGSIEPVHVTVSYLDQQLRRGTRRFVITGEDSLYQAHEVDEANPAEQLGDYMNS